MLPTSAAVGEIIASDEVTAAYDLVKEVDVLDTTEEGVEAWKRAIYDYDTHVNRVEGEQRYYTYIQVILTVYI